MLPLLHCGLARADITPLVSLGIFGYGEPAQVSEGLESRLYARAFAFRDHEESLVVYVCCELGFISTALRAEVLRRLGNRVPHEAICISATHTHAAPGGYSEYLLYNASTLGSSPYVLDVLAGGIVEAIEGALASLEPARVTYALGDVADAHTNRTPGPHRANPDAANPAIPDTDRCMTQIVIRSPDGRLRGVCNWFAVHCTSLDKKNRLISADNKGWAAAAFEAAYGGGIVAAFAQANSGDVSPNRVLTPDGRLEGEGATPRERVRVVGERQLRAAQALLDAPQTELSSPISARLVVMDFDRLVVPAQFSSTGHEERVGPALMGQNFLAGTKDGRGPVWFEEGDDGHALVVRLISRWAAPLGEVELGGHRPKRPLLSGGDGRWIVPGVLPVQLLRIGPLRIAAVPFEVTTVAGRRLRDAIAAADGLASEHVVIAALSNAYASYVTTPEEYDHQHYEGASTLFGREQLNALRWALAHLAGAATAAPPRCEPRPRGSLALPSKDRTQALKAASLVRVGQVYAEAPSRALAGTTVEVIFWALPLSLSPRGRSLVDIERLAENGNWGHLYDDRDGCTLVRWKRETGGLQRVSCIWEIPPETTAGSYRIVHRTGPAANTFVARSRTFEVGALGAQPRGDPQAKLFDDLTRMGLPRRILPDGEVLIAEGARDRSAVLVRRGQLSVRVGRTEVARIGVGQIAGEIGLFIGRARAASLVAVGATEVDILTFKALEGLVQENSAAVGQLERSAVQGLGERLRRQQHLLDLVRPRVRERTIPGRKVLALFASGLRSAPPNRQLTGPRRSPAETLASVEPLGALEAGELAWLAARFSSRIAQDGEVLCQEGEPGHTLFVVVAGEVEAMLGVPGGEAKPLSLGWALPGDVFGLIALVDQRPRSATCVARGRTELLVLTRAEWLSIFAADRPAASAMRRLAIRTLGEHQREADAQMIALNTEAQAALSRILDNSGRSPAEGKPDLA